MNKKSDLLLKHKSKIKSLKENTRIKELKMFREHLIQKEKQLSKNLTNNANSVNKNVQKRDLNL